MFSIESITCPSCKTKIPDELQEDNLVLIKSAYENLPISFRCFKCGYVITATPNVSISYEDIE